MTWTYREADLQLPGAAGELARVRQLVGDTDTTEPLLSDEVILAIVPSAPVAAILTASQVGTVATYNTSGAHGIANGGLVTVAGVVISGYNFAVARPAAYVDADTFTVDLAPTTGLSLSSGGLVSGVPSVIAQSSLLSAAIQAAGDIASYFARRVNKSVGTLRLDAAQKFEHYTQLAMDLRKRKLSTAQPRPLMPAGTVSGKDLAYSDPDRNGGNFRIGEFDNPESGFDTGSRW